MNQNITKMAAKKDKIKAVKVKSKVKLASAAEKDPNFMVQIPEARMLRKDILENVREIIIFMQGYERFRKIQEEKVAAFVKLRGQLRDLNRMIEDQLKKALPRGKLKAPEKVKLELEEEEEERAQPETLLSKPRVSAPPQPQEQHQEAPSELDELEAQLQSIEDQLNKVR